MDEKCDEKPLGNEKNIAAPVSTPPGS